MNNNWYDANKVWPKYEGEYLIYWRNSFLIEKYYNDKHGQRWGYNLHNVTAWTFLPDPPNFENKRHSPPSFIEDAKDYVQFMTGTGKYADE